MGRKNCETWLWKLIKNLPIEIWQKEHDEKTPKGKISERIWESLQILGGLFEWYGMLPDVCMKPII